MFDTADGKFNKVLPIDELEFPAPAADDNQAAVGGADEGSGQ
jgi:hypothetical protein